MRNYVKKALIPLMLWGFLLGIKNGYVALWAGEDPAPVYVSPVRASELPPADQLLLRRGIPITDPSALARLLEDYRDFLPAI